MTSLRIKYSSSSRLILYVVIICLLFGLFLKFNLNQPSHHTASMQTQVESPRLSTKEIHSQPKLSQSLNDAAQQAEYTITQIPVSALSKEYQAFNRANSFYSYFSGEKVKVLSTLKDKQAWQLSLKLKCYGYSNNLLPIVSGEVSAMANRLAMRKSAIHNPESAIEEWYVNKPEGLEQGFILTSPPSQKIGNEPLQVALNWSGNLQAECQVDNQAIAFLNSHKDEILRYDNLHAHDAEGRELPSHMKLRGREILLVVDDEQAIYPLTIDPILSQQTKLTANDGAADDEFGYSVAINGSTAIIGSPFADGAITSTLR